MLATHTLNNDTPLACFCPALDTLAYDTFETHSRAASLDNSE